MHSLLYKINTFFSHISYSTKVRLVIVFSSLLAVFSTGYLLNLQNPYLESLKIQSALIDYINAWTNTAISLREIKKNNRESIEKYETSFNILRKRKNELSEIIYQTYPKALLKLEIFTTPLAELKIGLTHGTYSKEFVDAQIEATHTLLIEEFFTREYFLNGIDIPTYMLTHLLGEQNKPTNDIRRTFLPNLSFVLKIIPEVLLPYPPGKILDDANEWMNTAQGDRIDKQLILQKDLGLALSSLLQYQLNTLLFRELMSLFSVSLGIFIVLTIYSTKVMRAPLTDLQFAAKQLTKGNLWQRATVISNDEVAKMCQGFNAMATLLEQAVTSTSIMSNKLKETMSTILNSAENFEQNVTDQDKTIGQIAFNTVGITQTSKEVVAALEQALLAATATHEFALSAQGNVRAIEVVLKGAGNAAQQIVATLRQIEEKVSSLNTIITTIITVADEANLLAINTALISSSKHQSRSGFGIIASKIGNLASKTAFVTLSIEESVKSILKALSTAGTQAHLLSMQMRTHSQEAAKLVDQFSVMMHTAADQRKTCARMHAAIQEQEKSAQQIHNTITLLSQGARITTRSVRNLYSQIQNLGGASSNLQIIFQRFHLHQ